MRGSTPTWRSMTSERTAVVEVVIWWNYLEPAASMACMGPWSMTFVVVGPGETFDCYKLSCYASNLFHTARPGEPDPYMHGSYPSSHTYWHRAPFLQRVSIACYAERCISHDRFCLTDRPSDRLTVWPSVCHTLVSCQNDSSYDHPVFR